jgi:hypothetical protein
MSRREPAASYISPTPGVVPLPAASESTLKWWHIKLAQTHCMSGDVILRLETAKAVNVIKKKPSRRLGSLV